MKTLHELLKQISHGVYVISVCDGEENNAFTAAWVMQVSFSPLLLAFSISPMHRTYKLLCRSGECAINVLKQDQTALALHFSSSDLNKMTDHEWQFAKTKSQKTEASQGIYPTNGPPLIAPKKQVHRRQQAASPSAMDQRPNHPVFRPTTACFRLW